MWRNSSWTMSYPKRWFCKSAALKIPANLQNSAVARGLQQVSFHSNPKEAQCQRMFKLPYIALISHTSKVVLKILQSRLQQYMNQKLPDVQAGFLKRQRNQRSNCQHPLDHRKSKLKHIYLYFIDYAKPLTVWITTNWKILRDGNTRPPYLPPEKPVFRSRNNC